jgi:hypothetical protein
MTKQAFRHECPPSHRAYGRLWPYFPTATFVIAYEGATLEILIRKIEPYWMLAQGEPENWMDAVFVLNRGCMTVWINRVLSEAWMPTFDINRYIDAAQIGFRIDHLKPFRA